MNRPDLHSAFTKINLWRQIQFRKIVYLDADVVAYRAPDELFDLPHAFSAAPDIGWPDLFNTGVMVLTPNIGDYYAMTAMAERGISFDGADQGLLNMYFKNGYNRLSFAYNVTPSAHYQYVPAYKHFQSSINMVHFIGTDKPWVYGREKFTGSSPFDEMVGRWWAVYDRHYRQEQAATLQPQQAVPEIVQYYVKGEYQPKIRYVVPVGEPPLNQPIVSHGQHYQPPPAPSHTESQDQQHQTISHSYYEQPEHHHHVHHEHHHYDQSQHDQPHHDHPPHREHHFHHSGDHHDEHHEPHHHHDQRHEAHHHHHDEQSRSGNSAQQSEHSAPLPSVLSSESFRSEEGSHTEAREEQVPDHEKWASEASPQSEHEPEPYRPPAAESWDAQRHAPPSDSMPEALNFPQTHYEMSSDPAPFVPPERYPSPPKGMWYEVPKQPPAPSRERPKPIFPWESQRPPATRVFLHQEQPDSPVAESSTTATGERKFSADSHPGTEHSASMIESSTAEQRSEPQTPTAAPVPWSSFPRSNAWDDVPEIGRYVESIQKHRRGRSQGSGPGDISLTGEDQETWGRRGSKVTDFPSVDDRPSLPVTPAPIRRPKFWGGGAPGFGQDGEDEKGQLPVAEGVPAQSDWVCVHGYQWTPADCLCDLTNVLRYHKDPIAQLQKLAKQQSERLLERLGGSGTLGDDVIGTEGREIPSRPLPYGSEGVKSPTYVAQSPPVVSPKPVKPDSATVRNLLSADHDTHQVAANPILAPSYQGPGASFEKGEDFPTFETPALPSEEELDVLET
ncbi:glycosyltransferase family 8 protein [Podospora didyma]|uniref:glycogenin glucosyltransferase n=1 Tax=Podospora didyma TaxID=330526 RepID=A0AAE0KJX3_9PEZI|nr:glycosyltransferase family 8 protein [Podospora didyma]